MLNQPTVTTDLLCKWPQKSSFIQISFAPVCAGRGATQIRPMAKLNKSNTLKASSGACAVLHRAAPVQRMSQSPASPGARPPLRVLPAFQTFEQAIPSFCSSPDHPFICSQAAAAALGSVPGRWVPSAPGVLGSGRAGEAGRGLGGRSSWQRSSTGIPGGCLIQSVPPVDQGIPTEVCRTKALSKPSSSPSQSVLPTATSSLSFVDKKQEKKKKRFP